MPDTITVDLVTFDALNDEFVLYFVESGPWPQDSIELEHALNRLQNKILDAADASIDGGVATVYPDSSGKKIRIQVDCRNTVPDEVYILINNIDKYLGESEEYSSAIKNSHHITGLRVISGRDMGRSNG